jgi:hypothetical protein
MDYILVDANNGNPIQCDNWKCADYLVFNATSMDDFEEAWRVGQEDDEHLNSKRILRCYAEIRTRYPGAVAGNHPFADTGIKSGVGKRVRAVRKDDGYYTELDLDGIKSYERMGPTQMVWHVWIDFFLRGEPVAVWIAHARNLGKYFVENMQLPVEEAEAQKYERQGNKAIQNASYRGQQALKENGTNGEHASPATANLIFRDRRTGENINVGELPACEIKVYPNPNWGRVVNWNPTNPYSIQEWMEFSRKWPVSVQ